DRNRSHWSTSKTPSYTKSVSWQHHLLSWGFFGQRLDLPAIIGMMLICAGVLVINLLSRSAPH
ncbi:hypothetical protein ACXYWD_24305, partial [Escherichia coli]